VGGRMTKVSKVELDKWRMLNAADVIQKLADYANCDTTYIPIKSEKSSRWYVTIRESGEYEILTTGPKWFDMRSKRGGGGAIDLVMHLYNIDFKQAVAKLRGAL